MKHGKKEGFAAAIEDLGAGLPPVCDDQQLSLFGEIVMASESDTESEGVKQVAEPVSSEKRPVGRPAGSVNRSTKQMRDYIGSKYPMPLEFLASIWSADSGTLVTEIGCKPEDVLKIKASAATAALPYLHKKMPQEVELTDTKRHLVLMEGMTSEAEQLLRDEDAIIIEVDENGEEITD